MLGRARGRVIAPGQNAPGFEITRAWTKSRISETSTSLISRRDRHVVRRVSLLLILGNLPHRKIVGREVIDWKVVSIIGPDHRGSVQNPLPTALTLDPRRCSMASHAPSLLVSPLERALQTPGGVTLRHTHPQVRVVPGTSCEG